MIGPNGSGKTSLIEALLQLRTLSNLAPIDSETVLPTAGSSPDLTFRFSPPYEDIEVRLGCIDDVACDALHVSPPRSSRWSEARRQLSLIRSYVFDHLAMAQPAQRATGIELETNGANLAAVLHHLQTEAPVVFAAVGADVIRLFPEFSGLDVQLRPNNRVAVTCPLAGGVGLVDGEAMSQGMLYMLGIITLSHLPSVPTVVCIEEVDRGVHPRMLREIRDALYRLSYPGDFGLARRPAQVIATAHSPYLLDLFRDHPEEIIISQKQGIAASFERLSDRPDLPQLLEEGSLGDLWFSGILGGVPAT